MNKKAFTILEIIFVIAIVSIIILVAIPKLSKNLQKADVVKIKNDVVLIREAIQIYKNKMILKNNTVVIDSLDDNSELLFNKILQYPIVASKEHKSGSWTKISERTYKVYIDSQNSVDFVFDNTKYTFDCDPLNEQCKELNN